MEIKRKQETLLFRAGCRDLFSQLADANSKNPRKGRMESELMSLWHNATITLSILSQSRAFIRFSSMPVVETFIGRFHLISRPMIRCTFANRVYCISSREDRSVENVVLIHHLVAVDITGSRSA